MKSLDYLAECEIDKLDDSVLTELLYAKGERQEELFAVARRVRKEAGADTVHLRGVVEISNHCQKKCDYCAMRVNNRDLERSRVSEETVMELATAITEMGIKTVFLQAGQEPGIDKMVDSVIPKIRKMGAEVLLCLGEKTQEIYNRWAALGATSYILKFEIADDQFYREVIHAEPAKRKQALKWLQESGLKVGTGNIMGLPNQTIQHILADLRYAIQVKPDFVSSSPFIPNEDTPLEDDGCGDVDMTLNLMAIWRIALRTPLIPTVSALERIRARGQLEGLEAGANVITINFTPKSMRDKFQIYSDHRFIVSMTHATSIVEEAGLRLKNPLRLPPTPAIPPRSPVSLSVAGQA